MFNKKFCNLCIIILLVFISTTSFANDNLTITRWVVDSTLENSGDLLISEDITFSFDDESNGVYRDIVLNSTDGIDDLKVYEMSKGMEIPYSLVLSAEKGQKDVFTVTEKGNTLQLMIFSPSEDETKTFRIEYKVKNVAVKHADTGELYYKFLGDENPTFIEYFTATINLPSIDRENTRIFAHGPLNGNINFVEDNIIKLEVSKVATDTFIEGRILFPISFINESNNEGNNSFDNIMKEELDLARVKEEKIANGAKNKGIFNNLSLIFSGFVAIITGFVFNKLRRDVDIYNSLNSNYPEDISPAELRLFTASIVDSRALITTVFDLARKGYMNIEEIEGLSKNKKDFQLSRTIRPIDTLLSHEEFFIDWIFDTIGDGNTVTTKIIEDYRKKNFSKFNRDFSLWNGKVKSNLKARDYYDKKVVGWGWLTLVISIFGFIIGITSVAIEAFYGILLLILAIFIFIYSMIIFTRKSDKGHIQSQLWKDFKKDLQYQNITIDDYNISIPQDKVLIYALALGLPMKSIDKFRDRFPESYNVSHWSYWYFITNSHGGSSFEDRFNSSFYGSSTGTTSSSIGGGGGFSGGGGGGAGGGGAGGF